MSATFELDLSFGQLAVFDAGLNDPFNDWTERHLQQGFTWRPGSVSFRTLAERGRVLVEIEQVTSLHVRPDAGRAILVPFFSWGGLMEVSAGEQGELVSIRTGRHALLFQTGIHVDGRAWASFGLMESPYLPVSPVILKADEKIIATADLLMEAEPAA